jgi:hypothetical protein
MTIELLKSASDIHGPNAPEKLLFRVFERKTATLKEKVKGDTIADRAKWLVKEREKEGFMSQFVTEESEGGPQILECHSPIMNLLDLYPIIGRLEQDLVGNVLGTTVRREESRASGLYECAFYFSASSAATRRSARRAMRLDCRERQLPQSTAPCSKTRELTAFLRALAALRGCDAQIFLSHPVNFG